MYKAYIAIFNMRGRGLRMFVYAKFEKHALYIHKIYKCRYYC